MGFSYFSFMIEDQESEIVLDNERGVKSRTWNYDAEPWIVFFHSNTSGSTGQKKKKKTFWK